MAGWQRRNQSGPTWYDWIGGGHGQARRRTDALDGSCRATSCATAAMRACGPAQLPLALPDRPADRAAPPWLHQPVAGGADTWCGRCDLRA